MCSPRLASPHFLLLSLALPPPPPLLPAHCPSILHLHPLPSYSLPLLRIPITHPSPSHNHLLPSLPHLKTMTPFLSSISQFSPPTHHTPSFLHLPSHFCSPSLPNPHLVMKGHLELIMIFFSEKMCSCCRVSTMCFFLRHLRANERERSLAS